MKLTLTVTDDDGNTIGISVPIVNAEIFNVSGDEPGGSDVNIIPTGVSATGEAGAVAVSEGSSASVSIDVTGVWAVGDAGLVAASGTSPPPGSGLPLDPPDPNQDTYHNNALDVTADLGWQSSDALVTGILWDVSPNHVAAFAGTFQNAGLATNITAPDWRGSDSWPSYNNGPKLLRVNVRWKDIEPTEGNIDWQPIRDILDNLHSSYVGVHMNVRGNALYVLSGNGNVKSGQHTAPQWLIDRVSPNYNSNNANNNNIIREVKGTRIIDNFDLGDDRVTDGWLKVIQAFAASGIPGHPKLHNQLLHGVSSSEGEEWTGDQADNGSVADDNWEPIIQAWMDIYKAVGAEKKLMWLKHTPNAFVNITLNNGAGIRGGGGIEKWVAEKYTPGDDDENGLIGENYEPGDEGSFYLYNDFNFAVAKENRAWQDQPEVVDEGDSWMEFHYRSAVLRCIQLRFDNIYTQNDSTHDPRLDHWCSYQLGRQPSEQSAEAFCYLGEFSSRGGNQWPGRPARMRNIQKWLYQHEDFGATGATNYRDYDKNIWTGQLEGLPAGAFWSRDGSTIGFAVDPKFIVGNKPVRISVTFVDSGTSTWSLDYDATGGGQAARSHTNTNSGDVQTATWYIPDFRGDFGNNEQEIPPTSSNFTLESNGNVDFMLVRIVKT